ncbi:hypothetical protein JL100_009195 [Skermanella mucosa]|uniref:hypothetical protein n=1 Tax=Skermanella mucosa TaxID=1789672 RepID=UPI00192B1805|nr:hypothetical protein [Skermanella mucosa]UEM22897.1 hypothetical protein JL100_009195 [Skermanella mucosa]
MRNLLSTVLLVSAIFLASGCATTGEPYSSGKSGSVDCDNFRIQSTRSDLKPATEKNCWSGNVDSVEYVATNYARHFESGTGYMNALLQVAGHNTLVVHRETQALLSGFERVRKEGTGWQELPSLESNGRKYRLSKFSLARSMHDCIGYSAFGNSFEHGYRSILFGYSCKLPQQGRMQVEDLQKDLDGLQVRM